MLFRNSFGLGQVRVKILTFFPARTEILTLITDRAEFFSIFRAGLGLDNFGPFDLYSTFFRVSEEVSILNEHQNESDFISYSIFPRPRMQNHQVIGFLVGRFLLALLILMRKCYTFPVVGWDVIGIAKPHPNANI